MKKLLAALPLFAVDGTMMYFFRRYPSFFFPAYRSFSKKAMAFLSSLNSPFPFSVWDIALALFVISVICLFIYRLIRRKDVVPLLSNAALIISVVIFIAVNGWMLNHYAPPLSEELGLDVDLYSKEELYEATEYYFDKACGYSLKMGRDEEGHVKGYDFHESAVIAGAAYGRLQERYPVFSGSADPVKRFSLVGDYLLYNGIVGMFMPVSGEASVPYHDPPVPLPFNMCHEAAHRLGLAGEDEANFAAFLACINNDHDHFIYSGYYQAFSYCFSSLYKTDQEKALELYASHEDEGAMLLKQDRKDTRAIYDRYDSPLREVSDQINDTYLKTFNEESGIQSYGEVTDYLIAWYEMNG